ncbi:unnamed protein product [Ranitomeya imitator]|uniref:Uncharacterized protein n=1 Tax=Ranitomeya imitator TaxID=111125 RepID=A0ABN9M173_9NEOB|nr:unnamed protein product [Ranitomeya imitator]
MKIQIVRHGNQGKHRVTKHGPALSYPMFTLVTGIVGRWRASSGVALMLARSSQLQNSSYKLYRKDLSPHKSYTMNINTVKTENGKVSCETAEGTVVHININQRSSLDCLLDTFRFFRDMRISGEKTMPSSTPACAAPLGFGVAYFSLGVVSVMLAIIFCVVPIDFGIFYSGAHFWVGFSFIVSGILNLVAYKFPKKFWMTAALISIVVNFSVSIGGMVVAVNDAQRLYWFGNEQLLQSCLIYMSLLIMIWGVCLAILYMACKVKSKSCCRSCKLEQREQKYSPSSCDVSSQRPLAADLCSEHDSEYESDASLDPDSSDFQKTVDSLIEAIDQTLKVDEDSNSVPDHAVHFED